MILARIPPNICCVRSDGWTCSFRAYQHQLVANGDNLTKSTLAHILESGSMLLFFYPVLMLGMIFVHKVFGVSAIANHRLILHTFVRSIFNLVAIVVLIRRFLIDYDFIGMVWIITTVTGWQRFGMFPN